VIFGVLVVKYLKNLQEIFHPVILIMTSTILFSLPFWLSFKPFGTGIGIICAPQFLTDLGRVGPFLFEANHCTRSPLWMLLILWGFPLFIVISFVFSKIRLTAKRLTLNALHPTDLLVLILALASFILILIPEFFYIKDIYPAHFRANTLFKFSYQAFIILGLICGYMMTRLLTILENSKFYILHFTLLILFTLVAIYPYFAINSYYSGLKIYSGLNGLSYLSNLYPNDYQAILWLKKNIKGSAEGEVRQGRQPVILEAQGDSYSDFARVSANTGLPTVIGWPVHEWLWRGSYDEAGKRSADVTTLYESADLNQTKDLLKKYDVSYVFVGTLERQKYLKLNENKFQVLGKIIFSSSQTRIYQIN
jgi:uncharacterized membrane protein